MMLGARLIQVKHMKKASLIMLMLCSAMAYSQRLPKNQPKYDQKPIHFGFSIGLNYSDFHIQEIEDLAALDNYYAIRSEVNPGYTIHIISNLRLSDYWDLRFTPGFSTTERTLLFDVIEPLSEERQEVIRKIESSYIEAPLHLKWKSQRINNYRLYVLGGMKYNIDLASKQDIDDDRVFKIKRNDFMYEFGFGVDIYFEFFKFSPQIKASWGTSDLMVDDGTFYIQGIDRLETRSILINFTFE
jgi:hypothetical protein